MNQNLEELKASLVKDMVKIPFSKSEIFVNQVLSLKEKRQLVKVIEMCLEGADQIDELEKKKRKEREKKEGPNGNVFYLG